MTDFLVVSGISVDTIKKLEQNPSDIFDLNCNKDEVIKIISYLKLIGIKNIEELLLVNTDLFLCNKSEVVELFTKKDLKRIVKDINEDSENIFRLYE